MSRHKARRSRRLKNRRATEQSSPLPVVVGLLKLHRSMFADDPELPLVVVDLEHAPCIGGRQSLCRRNGVAARRAVSAPRIGQMLGDAGGTANFARGGPLATCAGWTWRVTPTVPLLSHSRQQRS
jgi:hypothetical protein